MSEATDGEVVPTKCWQGAVTELLHTQIAVGDIKPYTCVKAHKTLTSPVIFTVCKF